jgi:site-specific recombinase XerD
LKRVRLPGDRFALPVAVTPHTFRRSCTTELQTELIRGGANRWHVQELLGHEYLDTLQHYAKRAIADLKKTHAKCHSRERES